MKIFIYIESFPYFSETFIYNQFKEFYFRRLDVKLIYHSGSGQKVNHSVVKLIQESGRLFRFRKGLQFVLFNNFFKYPFKSLLLLRYFSFKKALFYILNLDYLVEIENSDILHSHFGRVGEMAASLFDAGIFKNVKLVNSFHGADILPSKILQYKSLYKNLFKYSSLLLTNSQFSFDIVSRIDKSLGDRSVVLPVGVDSIFFERSIIDKDGLFQVIYVGRLINFKGAINVLKIAKVFSKSFNNVHFHIVGDGDDFDSIFLFRNENGLENIVTFHRNMSHENLLDLFQNCSVFLLPGITIPETGRAENQGLVIQEAQAMGLPVIISDAGGMKEGIIDGDTGFVVREGDIGGFCEKITFFFRNRDAILKFGLAGRNFVLKRFSNQMVNEKLISYYNSI